MAGRVSPTTSRIYAPARRPDDARALMTAVLATNLGLARMARSAGAFSHSRVLWVAEWHIRDETYQAGLACFMLMVRVRKRFAAFNHFYRQVSQYIPIVVGAPF